MQAGKLDRRLTILRATTGRDAFNATVETWGDFVTVWASHVPATGAERIAAHEKGAELTAVFEVRWSAEAASITPKDRVRFDGRELDIQSATEIGRREGVRIVGVGRPDRAAEPA